jgi:tetratricopeptide (TPR) repeat protein
VIVDREFFVSFTGADRPWAEWLLAELDAAGYSSVSQLRDFVAGANFALDMDRAARRARRTLGVLSPHALQAPYVQQEWAQRLASDPTGAQRALVLVQVEPCEPEGLLRPLVHINLVGLDEGSARERLREELAALVHGERQLSADPAFPGERPTAVVPDVQRPRFPTALPPVWNVPFRRNPTFTGREQALAELAAELKRGAAAVTQTLQGGGGVGKTALAVEYAYRYRSQFDTVWWIRADEPASLVGDFAGLARTLGLAEAGQADQQLAAGAVRRWLDVHDRWLVILDNAAAPDTSTGLPAPLARLVDLIPQVLHGQVLVTSRDASWEEYAALAELEIFTPDEAVAFLLARAGSNDLATAAIISERLGFLPLALEQAGAYVREARIGLAAYLDRLSRSPMQALAKGRPRDRDPADTVATTWQVSLERIRRTPGAAELLETLTFVAPDDVPRDLFTQALNPPPADERLAALAADPFEFDAAVAALHRYALVKASEEALSVHRLLQQVIRSSMQPDMAAARVGLAVRLLQAAFPEQTQGWFDPRSWPICEQLLPHALIAVGHAAEYDTEPAKTALLLAWAAGYLHVRSRFAEARPLYERALILAEIVFGPEHDQTSAILNNLGHLLLRAGDYRAARTALERSLAISEPALGPTHPKVGATLDNLGQAFLGLGDLSEARQHLERALLIMEAADEPDRVRIGIALGNLGRVLRELGDLDGARQCHERALAVKQAALGPNHSEVGVTLDNLGQVLRDLQDLAGARQCHERALAIDEAAHGPDYPGIGITLSNLGHVLRDLGDLAGARQCHERALEILEAAHRPDHQWVIIAQENLARVLQDLGDLGGARKHYERALAIKQAALGPNHLEVGTTLGKLGRVLHGLGDSHGARQRLERALAITEAGHGPEHPEVGLILNNLGYVLGHLGDQSARQHLERALVITEATLGADDLLVARILENLSAQLHNAQDLPTARQHLKRSLAIKEATLGPDHPEVANVLTTLSDVLYRIGGLAGARRHLERALAIREAAYGPDHPEVGAALHHLSYVLYSLGERTGARHHLERARQYLERALTIREAAYGPNHPEVGTTVNNLGQVVRDLGDLDGARRHLKRALAITEADRGPDHPETQALVRQLASF